MSEQTDEAAKMNAHTTVFESSPTHSAAVDARALIGEGTTRHINLDGQIYTLRITRAGKLILTK